MKIALFGGSFDPIHKGHLQIANELLKKQIVNQVWFIPCGNHPFNKNLSPGKERIKMINLAIENNPKLKVIELEINSKETSYTSKTIKTLKDNFPKDEFYFVIGTDNLQDLEKWNDFEFLKKKVDFILMNRPGFNFVNYPKIKIKYYLDIQNNMSSSQIRENLEKGVSIKGLVPERVGKYIKKEGLYD
jgi:nicotinate-nucleotide adenylyltransferase